MLKIRAVYLLALLGLGDAVGDGDGDGVGLRDFSMHDAVGPDDFEL